MNDEYGLVYSYAVNIKQSVELEDNKENYVTNLKPTQWDIYHYN